MGTGNGGLISNIQGTATHLLGNVKKNLMGGNHEERPAWVDDVVNKLRFQGRFNSFIVAMTMPNACSGVLSIKYSLTGPSATLASERMCLGHSRNWECL
jgi:hypothetical protein